MKLLVQADDFGISRAVARGIVYGIEHGLIRNTGLFANMPWAEECVAWIAPHLDHIALGLDCNLTTGRPLSNPAAIPSLVDESGAFYGSRVSRELDRVAGGEHATPDEVWRELEAQIDRFVALVGRKPDYLHAHAYVTDQIEDIERSYAQQLGVPYAGDVLQRINGCGISSYRIPWYVKPATLDNQAQSSLKDYLLEHGDELAGRDSWMLIGHMGYVDRDLMDLSSYTVLRANDLAGVTDPDVLAWVANNGVELITYRDIE